MFRKTLVSFVFVTALLAIMIWPAAAQDMPDHIHVNIDIKPGSYPNVINIKNNGVVPVALLGSADFNVSVVDTSTVGFGRMHEEGAPSIRFAYADVNRDGFMDIVFKFKTQATGLQPGDTEACLHGMFLTGEHFCGHDSVIVIG